MDYDAYSRQAYQQGQQRQQALDVQSQQAQQQYQQQLSAAQAAQKQQSDYAKAIQAGGQQAQDFLTSQYKQLGIQPEAIQAANEQVLRTQTALQGAQQAGQQLGVGRGATAGMQALATANLQSNLQNQLQTQTSKAGLLQSTLDKALANAQFVEQSQLASQQQKSDAYATAANIATNLLNSAKDAMTSIEALAQNQGAVTAQQVQQYQAAKAAAAQAGAAAAQAALLNQQYQANARIEAQNRAGLAGGLSQNAIREVSFSQNRDGTANYQFKDSSTGQGINALQWAKKWGQSYTDLIGTMASQNDPNAQALLRAGATVDSNGVWTNVPRNLQGAVSALGGRIGQVGQGATSVSSASRTPMLQKIFSNYNFGGR